MNPGLEDALIETVANHDKSIDNLRVLVWIGIITNVSFMLTIVWVMHGWTR